MAVHSLSVYLYIVVDVYFKRKERQRSRELIGTAWRGCRGRQLLGFGKAPSRASHSIWLAADFRSHCRAFGAAWPHGMEAHCEQPFPSADPCVDFPSGDTPAVAERMWGIDFHSDKLRTTKFHIVRLPFFGRFNIMCDSGCRDGSSGTCACHHILLCERTVLAPR